MTKRTPRINVFLDSGAYSAWTHKKVIPVKDYIKFVKATKSLLGTYVNLDVIPGTIDKIRTKEETEASAKLSYKNLQTMKDAGLRPLPVFHQGEPYSWLEKMIADGETYIGISTAKNQPNYVQERWLDEFFTLVTDRKGLPLVKVHGFGSAHVDLLRRHPYYSVDSAGWQIAAAYGKMYVPPYINDKPDYLASPVLVTMSNNFQTSPYSQERQLNNVFFGPNQRHVVRRFLEEEVGINIGMARHSNLARIRALAVYYQRVGEAIKNIVFKERGSSFRQDDKDNIRRQLANRSPIKKFGHLEFVFSTSYDVDLCKSLLQAGANHHLLSYFEIKNRPEILEAYAMEGKVLNRGPRTGRKSDWTDRRYVSFRGHALAKRVLKAKKEATDETRRPHIKTRDGKAGSGC